MRIATVPARGANTIHVPPRQWPEGMIERACRRVAIANRYRRLGMSEDRVARLVRAMAWNVA